MQELAHTSLPPSIAASPLVPKAAAWIGFGDGSMVFLPFGTEGVLWPLTPKRERNRSKSGACMGLGSGRGKVQRDMEVEDLSA